MADVDFVRAVDALYAAIDMPAPLRGEVDDRHELAVEDIQVVLEPSRNGLAVIVTAAIGELAAAEPGRSREAAAVLRPALALMPSNRAAVALSGGRLVAVARAALGGTPREVGQRIKRAIEDVVEQVSWHAPALAGRRDDAFARPAPSAADDALPPMIFRP